MDLIVVGGGAAGMLCAIGGARAGKSVTIIEKNEKLGKKLFISGKGRCNLTNIAERDEFFSSIYTNPKFLYSSFSAFGNKDIISLVEINGVPLKIERGGRVFPLSDKSSDVIKALKKELDSLGVSVVLNTKVKSLIIKDRAVKGVVTDKGEMLADSVAVCTGGMSYSSTGSTGDGYRFAKEAGHRVTELVPSLVPINCSDRTCKELQGLTLKNVELVCKKEGKTVFCERGELLFAHFGITGPLVLTLSAALGNVDFKKLELYIDLKPALNESDVDNRLIRDFEEYNNKQFNTYLSKLLPKKMIPVFLELLRGAGIDEKTKVNSLTKEQRKAIIALLKHFKLTPIGYRPIDYAIVTKGGIDVKEINPKTMESKLVRGLFFAGEVLDVDGKTGGFNLQIAFSTGYCAGIGSK